MKLSDMSPEEQKKWSHKYTLFKRRWLKKNGFEGKSFSLDDLIPCKEEFCKKHKIEL